MWGFQPGSKALIQLPLKRMSFHWFPWEMGQALCVCVFVYIKNWGGRQSCVFKIWSALSRCCACTNFLFMRLLALFGIFPAWNKIPYTGESWTSPEQSPEDTDCLGHIWTLAGVSEFGWILPYETTELEPQGREAG